MLPASKKYLFAFRKPQNTYQLLTIEQDSSKRERKTRGLCVSSPQSPLTHHKKNTWYNDIFLPQQN